MEQSIKRTPSFFPLRTDRLLTVAIQRNLLYAITMTPIVSFHTLANRRSFELGRTREDPNFTHLIHSLPPFFTNHFNLRNLLAFHES